MVGHLEILICKLKPLPELQPLPLSALIIDRNHILLPVERSVPSLCEPARMAAAQVMLGTVPADRPALKLQPGGQPPACRPPHMLGDVPHPGVLSAHTGHIGGSQDGY